MKLLVMVHYEDYLGTSRNYTMNLKYRIVEFHGIFLNLCKSFVISMKK